ncbi:MAG: neutral/alkaline non-lysosomal ceramidase N-terminal domain-containing protein [Victivallaceae bacterium]|nr:neutral/alkaline non-lysosomal ceramidase N-terminal domain-containing protein [Victivallaceae bacterium]
MKTGFSIVDITPPLGIFLTGYGRPQRLATNVHTPLTATAMYLADGDAEAAVISVDWCFVDAVLAREIAEGISKVSGVPADGIVISCIHTHSAPHTSYWVDTWRGATDPEQKGLAYAKSCIPALAKAVSDAKSGAREAAIAFKAGKTETGISRRGQHETGEINMLLGDPDMVYDDNLTVARFIDAETKEDLGILVHCSAHNTAMGITTDISSDWCGVMRNRVNTRYSAPVVFLNGAIGDVGPRTRRWFEGEDFRGFSGGCGDGIDSVLEVGYRAANDVLALLENLRDFRNDVRLDVKSSELVLPQEICMTVEKANATLKEFEGIDPAVEARLQWAIRALEMWKKPLEPELRWSQALVAIGPLAIVPAPLEVFSILSLRLRKYSPYEYTLLCSNANGFYGYMPDRGAIACGGYEVLMRPAVRPYVFTPDAGDVMVVQCLAGLREMKK